MSIRIMTQVWDYGPEDQGQLLVLLAMADFADDAGVCWPAMESIARKARMSVRNVRYVVRKLEADGLLQTEPSGGRRTNTYKILCNPANVAGSVQPGKTEPSTRQNEAPTRQNGALNPATAIAAEPSRTVIDPSETPLTPHSILSEVLRPETASDFIAHRKAMKKPVTPEAAKRLLAKVRDHPDPDSVFDESIANGWQGVFPERTRQNAGRSNRDGQAADLARQIGEEWAARNVDRGPRPGASQPLLPARPAHRGSGGGA